MGRVLLADLPEDELEAFRRNAAAALHRDHDHGSRGAEDALREVREQGFAFVDEELEIGLRSIAAPVTGRDGRTIAALNVSAAAARVSIDEMRERFLPALLQTTD